MPDPEVPLPSQEPQAAEIVGPQQFAGEDEPGPDANRRVGGVGEAAVGAEAVEPTPITITDGNAATNESELPRHHFTGDSTSNDPKENEALAWDMAHAARDDMDTALYAKRELEISGKNKKPSLEKEIAEYRRRAEQDEEWVRVLHEHPISEAFKQTYPDEGLGSVWDLINLEYNTELLEEAAQQNEKESPYDDRFEEGNEGRDPATLFKEIERLLGSDFTASDELIKSLKDKKSELDASDSTTIGDYVKLYKDICTKPIEKTRQDAQALRNILDEIKSGRASDPNYQKPTEEPTAQPEVEA
ncbi:MAG: hypothetical protein Q7R60_02190 [bacterium]|nr:hypothetical protein [bacterium]